MEWPGNVVGKQRCYGFCLYGVLTLLLGIAFCQEMYNAINQKSVVSEEDPEWGPLPNIMLDSTVGIEQGMAYFHVPGKKEPVLTIQGEAEMVGSKQKPPPRGLRMPPPCRCIGRNKTKSYVTRMRFPFEEKAKYEDLLGLNPNNIANAKLGIKFDIRLEPCAAPAKFANGQKKCPLHDLKIEVTQADGPPSMEMFPQSLFPSWKRESCPEGQCPLTLTINKKVPETGWPADIDYYLFKKYRGTSGLFSTSTEAHYRVAAASVGGSYDPNSIKLMMKVDTKTVPVKTIETVGLRVWHALSVLGGYLALAGAVFGMFFMHKQLSEEEAVEEGIAPSKALQLRTLKQVMQYQSEQAGAHISLLTSSDDEDLGEDETQVKFET